MVASLVAAIALVIWIYLVAGRGGSWCVGEREGGGPSPLVWRGVYLLLSDALSLFLGERPTPREAAAAGGCMLVRRDALQAAGGIEAIRGSLIDDCAMARLLKKQGPIRLSLSEGVIGIRPYSTMGEIRRMVVRSAYAQLRFSPLLLAVALAGPTFVFAVPVLAAFFVHGAAQIFGLLAWVITAVAFQPTLRFYGLLPLWGPILPAIALVYMAFTLESAYQSMRGRGGLWKGRVQARAVRAP